MAIPIAPYNLTLVSGAEGFGNDTGMLTLVQGINTEIFGGIFGALFLAALFMIFLMSFLQTSNSPARAFTSALFICFALSIPMVGLNLLSPYIMIVLLVLTALSLFFTFAQD